MNTLLLDARGVSGGASGRNGGCLGGATFTQLPVMPRTTPFWEAWQVIRLKKANRRFIHDFCKVHAVPVDLDAGVDGVDFFNSREQMDAALGWWRHCPRPLLRLVGVRVETLSLQTGG